MVVLGLRDRLKEAEVDQAEAMVGLELDGIVEEDPWGFGLGVRRDVALVLLGPLSGCALLLL